MTTADTLQAANERVNLARLAIIPLVPLELTTELDKAMSAVLKAGSDALDALLERGRHQDVEIARLQDKVTLLQRAAERHRRKAG